MNPAGPELHGPPGAGALGVFMQHFVVAGVTDLEAEQCL